MLCPLLPLLGSWAGSGLPSSLLTAASLAHTPLHSTPLHSIPIPTHTHPPAGILSLLEEREEELNIYALKKLDLLVDQFWVEISESITKM